MADPPPPLQTHPHTHTMREKRRYNGALRILPVFQGRAGEPTSQGGGGGYQSLPAAQPRLGTAPWYYFFFRKIGLSWRRVSKAQRTLLDNFEEIKRTFLLRLVYVCALHNIPPDLAVNADETGVLFVPCSKEPYGERGSDQVSLQGFGDKRQFTLLFGVSAPGKTAGRF